MRHYGDGWFALKVFFKRWYFTILIPLFCAIIVMIGLFNYYNHTRTYTVSASFVLTGEDKDLSQKEDELEKTENRIATQKMNGELITTYKGLVLHEGTLYSTLADVEKEQKYSKQQLIYKVIPKYRSNLKVNIVEGESLIFNVVYKGKNAKRAARFVNELVVQTAKNEKKLLGTVSIKKFTKAVPPMEPDSKIASIFKITLVFGLFTWLLIFPIVITFERKRLN